MSASFASVVQRCQHGSAFSEEKPSASLPISVEVVAVKPNCKMHPRNVGVELEEGAKKYARLRSDQTVHLIPFVLLFCALILWLGSTPAADKVGVAQAGKQGGLRQADRSGGGMKMEDMKWRRLASRSSDVTRADLRRVMPKRLRGPFLLVGKEHNQLNNGVP